MKRIYSLLKLLGLSSPLLLLFLVLMFACGGSGVTGVPTTNSSGPSTNMTQPANVSTSPVISFSADPSTITAGQTTTLSWKVSNATKVSINQGKGTVPSSGTQKVSPTANTTYILTATNNAGSVNATAIITVNPSGLPFINSFTANPKSISLGQSSTLQWDITGATSVYIDQGIINVPSSGTQVVSPTATTIYTLTATNSAGSVISSVTVTVSATSFPVINSFTANQTSISLGQSLTLKWDTTGADSVSIDQGIGTVPSSGTLIVSPKGTTTYTLTATNGAGSVPAIVTVVGAALPVITTFTASPTTINAGQSSTLRWNVTGATSVSINPGSAVSLSGTQVVIPTTKTTYIITATNSAGSVNLSVTVTVN